MRTRAKLFAVFCLILATFSTPTTASAGDIQKFKNSSADAFFLSLDTSGCIETRLWVWTGDPMSFVGLNIRQYDNCNGLFLRDAYGSAELADPDFQLTVGNLASATLKATVPLYDDRLGSSFNVFVDLTWTGVGPLSRFIHNETSHGPHCHEIFHHNGVVRSAVASGTISDGQTNFTPEPSREAHLFLDKYVDISNCKLLR